ncbi:caspase family protein [Oscillatoria sp. FACHB-1407]|uniref:caspase family protein n=1 Tax=Oscillatoria sp. FACHB-1407 TaxID=2692847 RepID=UPI001682B894|nr:caspase family protein [Oscillatoria sp. FACHB-1407]MBD2464607.1 caspase family protein [Oscillatoria sp. FACHB-1407]
MVRAALLVGVSQYGTGLKPLSEAPKDAEAIARVLRDPDIGGFEQVSTLTNPTVGEMQEAIERFFKDRQRDDLVLFFFSGHGIKDDSNRFYFGTQSTRKDEQGKLVRSSAVSANFVQEIMDDCRSKRQVVILDCCFSGAFGHNVRAKDDDSVEIKGQLGGEGRAILTSSTSTQYSFEQSGAELSVYTRYVVEGIETGAADLDNDGNISVDELHDYARQRVREAAPAMKPEIYPVKEGYKIFLTKAPVDDPALRYRREVQRYASRGEISSVSRTMLEFQRQALGVLPETASLIEEEVLQPYQAYKENLRRYQQVLLEALQKGSLDADTREDLQRFRYFLGLRQEDAQVIQDSILNDCHIQVEQAFREQDWVEAIAPLQLLLALQPDNRECQVKLDHARRQKQLAEWYNEARWLSRSERWQEVIQKLERIRALAATYPDPEHLWETAQTQLSVRPRPTSQIQPVPSHPSQSRLVQKQSSSPGGSVIPIMITIALLWLLSGVVGIALSTGLSVTDEPQISLAVVGAITGAIDGVLTGLWLNATTRRSPKLLISGGIVGGVLGAIGWALAYGILNADPMTWSGSGATVGALLGFVTGAIVLWGLAQTKQP